MALINTIAANKSRYTKRDYLCAVSARKTQNMIGRPSVPDYIRIVDNRLLRNCPVTRDDIIAVEDIFGPNLGSLKGKMTRRRSPQVRMTVTDIPPVIMERYMRVTLAVDIMKVNKIPFLMTVSCHLKFGTNAVLANKKGPTLAACLKDVC